jgi:RNA polymerase sigma-70 factor (ECF subfamily)
MAAGTDPEREAALADSVGVALLVVLQMLAPAERVAFVLHDMFDLPFEEIGPIVGRTPIAARQLASRARRRVHGGATLPAGELARQRGIVDAYLAASRTGDFEGLLAVLDPDVVLHADRAVLPAGASQESRTAPLVARRALAGRASFAQAALINGSVGVVVARRGRLHLVLSFVFGGGRITGIDVIGDAERLAALDIKVFG